MPLDGILALLTEDMRLSMPPNPFEYHGRAVAAQGLGQLFRHGHRYQLIQTRANGQAAFGVYLKDPHADVLHASGLMVLTLDGTRVSGMTVFDNGVSVLTWPLRNLPGQCASRITCWRRITVLYAALMGLIQSLGYKPPVPNAAQRAMWHISSSRPGAWLFARSIHHVDKVVLRLSRGQATLAGLTAGIPVLTVTTTGARSGQPRTTPLLGVPFGDDIAIIGTHFGQPGTPGWYYNLRARPRAEVTYRNRSVAASAREADDDEWQAIWSRARTIYGGYEAYARRITDRKIRIMILSG